MGDFICFCLGLLELTVAFAVVCLGVLCIAYAHGMFWDIKTDKVQFVKWLTEKGDEHGTDDSD